MKGSRISILFFVIFLMIITPLTPMSSAVNARSPTISGNISWYNGPGSVSVTDDSDNYMINVSGTFVRSEYNYHYDYDNDYVDLNVLSKASFQDYNKGNSLAWMDVPSGLDGGNVTDYWSIIRHEISRYNTEVSQYGNLNNSGFNSDNFCLFQESFPAGTVPFSNYYNYASNSFSHWCAPADLTVNSFTYPTIDIDVSSTSPGTVYNLFYDIIDCITNNVTLTRLVEFTGQSGTVYLESYLANLSSNGGNYKLYAQIQDQQTYLDSFTTSCTGTQGGGSGTDEPTPRLDSIQVSGVDGITGLQNGEVTFSNLTPNTQYDFIHSLYSYVYSSSDGGYVCSYDATSGGISPIHSFSNSLTTTSSHTASTSLSLDFKLGANYTNAEPFELHAGTSYCYVFVLRESSLQDWQIHSVKSFTALQGFSGCGLSQFCWDHQEHAEGASFSLDGRWVTYSRQSTGDAISNIGLTPGQWYWEIDVLRQSGNDNFAFIGVHTGEENSLNLASTTGDKSSTLALDEYGWAFDSASFIFHDTSIQLPCSYGGCWTALQYYTIGVALDSESGSMWYSVDGKWLDYNYGNSGFSPRNSSQQIFGFEEDPGGMSNWSHWENQYGNSELSGKTLYPAVSDTGIYHGMSFKLVPGSTTYQPPEGFNVIDDFVLDSDNDGILNYLEIEGCTDQTAINYNPLATENDGSCSYQSNEEPPNACEDLPMNSVSLWHEIKDSGDIIFHILYNVDESFSRFAFDTPSYEDLEYGVDQVIGGEWIDAGHVGFLSGADGYIEGYQNSGEENIDVLCGVLLEIEKTSNNDIFEYLVINHHQSSGFFNQDNENMGVNFYDLSSKSEDILILSDNNNNIPDKFDTTYEIVKTPLNLYGSGYSREINVGGDYYSYWNEDNNYLIAWDSVNGYWMVYHLNEFNDTFYNTLEVVNALDDSNYGNLDGKTFSWINSDDYSSIHVPGSENYPGTFFKIPLEEDSIVYGYQNQVGLEGWCLDTDDSLEVIEYPENSDQEECENSGFSWILALEPELYWGNGDENPHVMSIDVDFDGTAPFPGLHEIDINLNVYAVNPNLDNDGDGMPNFWEVKYGLDSNMPLDANDDPDGDGLTNLEEFYLGTSPINPDTDGDGLLDPSDTENGVDLSIPELLHQETIQNNMDLEGIYGFIEVISNLQQFPDGLRYYCVNITISDQASGSLRADALDCFELDVNDAFSGGGSHSSNPLHVDILWNPDNQRMEIYSAVNYQNDLSDVHLDFSINSYENNYDFSYEYNYGLLSFNELNQANLGMPVIINPDEIGMQYERNYCIKFILEANPGQPDEEIIAKSVGCFYLEPSSLFYTGDVDWNSDVSSGFTSVTSSLAGNEGTRVIDKDPETSWISQNACSDNGNSEYIILGVDFFEGEQLTAAGISIKWDEDYLPESFDISKKVNGNWELMFQNFEMESDLSTYNRMRFIFAIDEIEEIKITCRGNLGQMGIAEVVIHGLNIDSDGDGVPDIYDECPTVPGFTPNGCIDDNGNNSSDDSPYFADDLTDMASVYTSSNYMNNDGMKSIDNDYNTFWESDGSCPQDIVIEFGEPRYVGLLNLYFNDEITNGGLLNLEIKFWDTQNNWYTNQYFGLGLDTNVFSLNLYPQMTERVMIKCDNFNPNIKINEIEIFESKNTWFQYDIDNDGIINDYDQCFAGIQFTSDVLNDYDGDGCLDNIEDNDDDNDGINDEFDLCQFGEKNWFSWDNGTDYDHDGCLDSTEDNDDDADGVDDFLDNCSQTRLGANVDSFGCETSFDDGDSDGVADSYDQCPNTENGVEVDEFTGCPLINQKHIDLSTNFDERNIEFAGETVQIESDQGWPSVLVSVEDLEIGTQYQINAKMWDYSVFPEEEMFCNNWPSQIITGPCENSYSFTAQQKEMTMTLHYPALESSTQACLIVILSSDDLEIDNNMICWNQDSKSDWDLDGIIDINDLCGATPINSTVNETGCLITEPGNNTSVDELLDTDGDGVPDFDAEGNTLDECPDSEEGIEVDEVGCSTAILLPPALASALDFVLNIDSLLGLPDGTLEILFAALGMMFGVIRFVGKRTLAGKSKRVKKYAKEIRLSRSRRELENLEKRITKDNEKKLLPPGGFGDLMELIETRALELGETDLAHQVHSSAEEYEMSQGQMLEEMEDTRRAVEGLQEELSEMRRKGPPGKGRGRKGPPRRRTGSNNSGYQMKQAGGPRRPSLHPADLDGDGFVTEEEKRLYRQRQEQEDGLWEYD